MSQVSRASLIVSIFAAAIICFAILSIDSYAYNVTLAWDPVTDPTVAGIQLYAQQAPGGPFEPMENTVDPKHSEITVSGLNDGVQYGFYVTAIAYSGLESEPSNMVYYTALPKLLLTAQGLTIYAKAGNTYSIFQSPDLITWTKLGTVTPQVDIFNYPVAFNQPHMFFKIQKE